MNAGTTARVGAALVVAAMVVIASCSQGAGESATPPGGPKDAGQHDGTFGPESGICVPGTCAERGIQCGSAPDGCGSALSCGLCSAGMFCGGAGPNKCGTKACSPVTCQTANAECGMVSDGCSSVINCGACPTAKTCSTTNRCEVPVAGAGGSNHDGGAGGSANTGGGSGNGGATTNGGSSGQGGAPEGGSGGGCDQGSTCDPGVACREGSWDCGSNSCQTGAMVAAGSACSQVPEMHCTAAGDCVACTYGGACNPTPCTYGTANCSTGNPVCAPNGLNAPSGAACPAGTCNGGGQCILDCVPDGTCTGLPACTCLPGKVLNEFCYDSGGAFNETALGFGCANNVQAEGVDSCGKPCTGPCIDSCPYGCHDGGNADCTVDRGYGPPANGTCGCD